MEKTTVMCDRCGVDVFDPGGYERVYFDNKRHDLCSSCFAGFGVWMQMCNAQASASAGTGAQPMPKRAKRRIGRK